MFGCLNLLSRRDYTRFLTTHALALAACQKVLATFVTQTLKLKAPRFVALINADLEHLGAPSLSPAKLALPEHTDPIGVAYVILGSRLGLTVLRQQGFWSDDRGAGSGTYMHDDSGLALWRGLVAWLRGLDFTPAQVRSACAGADASFDVFRQAFAATESSNPRFAKA